MILLTDLRWESLNIQLKMKLPHCTAGQLIQSIPLSLLFTNTAAIRILDQLILKSNLQLS